MQVNESSLFFVFDVESVGLYGEGFAVGWTVVDLEGKEHESGLFVADWRKCEGHNQKGAREWLESNLPPMEVTHQSANDLCFEFFNVLQRWLPNNISHTKVSGVWADWLYPVEANFLAQCREVAYWRIEEDPSWLMPAPLHEIATLQLAAGITDDLPRLPSELPEHNPLNDARHSARLLVKAMAKLREQCQLANETMIRG